METRFHGKALAVTAAALVAFGAVSIATPAGPAPAANAVYALTPSINTLIDSASRMQRASTDVLNSSRRAGAYQAARLAYEQARGQLTGASAREMLEAQQAFESAYRGKRWSTASSVLKKSATALNNAVAAYKKSGRVVVVY